MGLERFRKGERDDPFAVEPLYLRASSAEENWAKLHPPAVELTPAEVAECCSEFFVLSRGMSRRFYRARNSHCGEKVRCYNRNGRQTSVNKVRSICGVMNAFLVRPRVAELVFQLYGKPLHPELFDILAAQQDSSAKIIELRIWITRTGHVITWENEDVLLTEVADADQAFSEQRRFLRYPMRGEHSGRFECCHGILYQTSFQVETVPEEIYLHVHDEILADGSKHGILHNFQPNHRLAIAPLGYVVAESRPRCLMLSDVSHVPGRKHHHQIANADREDMISGQRGYNTLSMARVKTASD